jgi:hypothetical protein
VFVIWFFVIVVSYRWCLVVQVQIRQWPGVIASASRWLESSASVMPRQPSGRRVVRDEHVDRPLGRHREVELAVGDGLLRPPRHGLGAGRSVDGRRAAQEQHARAVLVLVDGSARLVDDVRRDLGPARAADATAELAQPRVVVVIAVDEAQGDTGAHEHVGELVELVAAWPEESPVAELYDLGPVLARERRGARGEVEVVVRVAEEEVLLHVDSPFHAGKRSTSGCSTSTTLAHSSKRNTSGTSGCATWSTARSNQPSRLVVGPVEQLALEDAPVFQRAAQE